MMMMILMNDGFYVKEMFAVRLLILGWNKFRLFGKKRLHSFSEYW